MADNITYRIEKKINLLVWFGLIIFAFIPKNWIIGNGISMCLHKVITGYECPLCGLTKSTWSFANFYFKDAFFYNPVFYLLVFIFFFWTITIWLKIKKGKLMKVSLYLLLVSFISLYVYRFF